MRRSSRHAKELSDALGDVSPRQIESWTQDGLGAERSAPTQAQLDHYRELKSLGGPGRGRTADSSALRMAAHGYACDRLKPALLRRMNISDVAVSPKILDVSSDAEGDDAFDEVVNLATEMQTSLSMLPTPIRHAINRFISNLRAAEVTLDESADSLIVSVFSNMLCVLLGADIYDPKPLIALVGSDGLNEADVESINFPRVTVWEFDDTYRTSAPTDIARMALWLRSALDLIVAEFRVTGVSSRQLDEFAAMGAPCVLRLVWSVKGMLSADDLRALLDDLHIPMDLVLPQRSLGELMHAPHAEALTS